MTTIYELVDVTSGEEYYPLGVWGTLEEAIAALDRCKDPSDIDSSYPHDDYAKVEIRVRPFGWGDGGEKIFEREWVLNYDEETGEETWEVKGASKP